MCAAMPMLRVRSRVYSRLGEFGELGESTGLASALINQKLLNCNFEDLQNKSSSNGQNGAWIIREITTGAINFYVKFGRAQPFAPKDVGHLKVPGICSYVNQP